MNTYFCLNFYRVLKHLAEGAAKGGSSHSKKLGAARTMIELRKMIAVSVAMAVDGALLLKRTNLEEDDLRSGTSATAAATLIIDKTTWLLKSSHELNYHMLSKYVKLPVYLISASFVLILRLIDSKASKHSSWRGKKVNVSQIKAHLLHMSRASDTRFDKTLPFPCWVFLLWDSLSLCSLQIRP